ncbi:hypothetical protein [Sphingomonas sp. ID0503]|uniref:hypothetical protein n=1 Tax=Sphingomonas sp. ID0503 TaxID=3399691 RepID=UPI003AFB05AF
MTLNRTTTPTSLFIAGIIVATGVSAAPARAQGSGGTPPVAQALFECRGIADDAARLRCFDEAAGRMAEAEKKKDLVMVDRSQIREARRSLFGLTLPDLKIFGGGEKDEKEEGVSELTATVRSAQLGSDGKWLIILEDGARWKQTDGKQLAGDPRPGSTIRIRKAAMGSYLANVGKQTAIRVRRMN